MDKELHLKLTIRLYTDDNRRCFGPGIATLLERVREHRSLRAAAASMEMAYSKAWRIIRTAEEVFGCKMLDSTTGGRHGGAIKAVWRNTRRERLRRPSDLTAVRSKKSRAEKRSDSFHRTMWNTGAAQKNRRTVRRRSFQEDPRQSPGLFPCGSQTAVPRPEEIFQRPKTSILRKTTARGKTP